MRARARELRRARAAATGLPSPAAPAPPRRVVLIRDSLAEGIAPLLSAALGGTAVATDAKISRPLATGMALVRNVPPGVILAISLFTNDDPRHTAELEHAVRASVAQVGPGGCVVWATVVRPPYGGVSYAAANRALRRLAASPGLRAHLHLVFWDRATGAHPEWLAGDHVHATPLGYQARAGMYAAAIRQCQGGGGD